MAEPNDILTDDLLPPWPMASATPEQLKEYADHLQEIRVAEMLKRYPDAHVRKQLHRQFRDNIENKAKAQGLSAEDYLAANPADAEAHDVYERLAKEK